MATKRLRVNVSYHQHRLKTPFLGELPELNISQQSRSFTGLTESNGSWLSERGPRSSCMYSDYIQSALTRSTECGKHRMRYCSFPANPPSTRASCQRLDPCKWGGKDYCHMQHSVTNLATQICKGKLIIEVCVLQRVSFPLCILHKDCLTGCTLFHRLLGIRDKNAFQNSQQSLLSLWFNDGDIKGIDSKKQTWIKQKIKLNHI